MSFDDSDDIGFLRQRRNVILMSLTLLFFEMVGLRITELSLLGNKVFLDNPFVIDLCLVIFYSYFLIRYHQIYLSDKRGVVLENAKRAYKYSAYHTVDDFGEPAIKEFVGWREKINYQIKSKINFIFREPAYSDIQFPLDLSITCGIAVLTSKIANLL